MELWWLFLLIGFSVGWVCRAFSKRNFQRGVSTGVVATLLALIFGG